MTGIIAIVMTMSIPLAAIIGSFYYKLQKLKLEHDSGGKDLSEIKNQLDYLMAENEALKDRLLLLEQTPSDERRPIELEKREEKTEIFRHK